MLNQAGQVVGRHATNEKLAAAGAGDRAGAVVGIGARANDGAVTDPAVALVDDPSGRGRGSEVTRQVERDRTDGAEFFIAVVIPTVFDRLPLLIAGRVCEVVGRHSGDGIGI